MPFTNNISEFPCKTTQLQYSK